MAADPVTSHHQLIPEEQYKIKLLYLFFDSCLRKRSVQDVKKKKKQNKKNTTLNYYIIQKETY